MKLISLFMPAALAYSLCDPANYPYKGQNVSIQLVQSGSKVLNQTVSIPSLTGSIQVVDGCTFQLSNLVLNVPSSVFQFEWYGAFKKQTDGISLSATPVQTGNATSLPQTFAFKNAAGSSVSFKDFDQFRLYETTSKTVVATADLPPNPQVVEPTTSPSPSSGSNPGTTGSTAANTPKAGENSDLGLSSSNLLLAAVFLII